eukprot:SAG31_NODE_9966_length_1203_cov_1.419384_1_plen_314_part_10
METRSDLFTLSVLAAAICCWGAVQQPHASAAALQTAGIHTLAYQTNATIPTMMKCAEQSKRYMLGNLPVENFLSLAGLQKESVGEATKLLIALGVRTAVDMQVLSRAPVEAEELMGELKAAGVRVGDRAKIRVAAVDHQSLLRKIHEARKTVDTGAPQPSVDARVETRPRHLQESGVSMSVDTIAIVLSVLVGSAGYFVQAWTAQRAERSAAAQAQENHRSELNRQREHEQMLAQMERTDRGLDECCRPIEQVCYSIHWARGDYVGQIVARLEATQPELVETMVQLTQRDVKPDKDGRLHSRSDPGRVTWEPKS